MSHSATLNASDDADALSGETTNSHVPKPQNRELVSASLRLLTMRDMSRIEFQRKLAVKGYEQTDIAEAAAWCIAEGWLNEARFAEVAARRLGHKYGASRVAQSLKQKGVTESAIEETITALKATELDRARAMWMRKFGEVATSADAKAKQMRYLQTRGFSYAVAKEAVRGEVSE
jgi:regulatory protein